MLPLRALPMHSTLGQTPQCSRANIRPVFSIPVMTSSEIRGIPYSLQVLASSWKYPSGGTTFDTLQTCSTQLEQLIRSMDANGIKMATVFAMRRLDDYNEANQYIASSAKKYPDRIIPLAQWARFKFTAKKR